MRKDSKKGKLRKPPRRRPTPMVGKLVNIDLWLSRNEAGVYELHFDEEPQYDTADGQHYSNARSSFLNTAGKRIFSGLKPTEYCRVRMQRMD